MLQVSIRECSSVRLARPLCASVPRSYVRRGVAFASQWDALTPFLL